MQQSFRVGGASRVANSFLFTLLLIVTACSSPHALDASGNTIARVKTVVDGDTIEVSIGGHTETVRLIGIDTPETKHPTKPIECWGPEASAFTHSLLPPRTEVVLVRDEHARDKYGRLLVYLYRRFDMLFVNRELVRGGWARTLSIPPNTTYETVFERDLKTAREQLLGLWSRCPR